jgi:putative oxidoreductase
VAPQEIDMGFLDKFSGPLLSILRIVSALLFMEHGTSKLLGFPPTEMFAQPPETGSLIWIAGVLEMVGGALLALGLFTRPVAFVLSGQMAVAYWTAHASQSFYPVQNQGDAAILFCFVFLYIAATGGGPWALDRVLAKKA